MIDLPIVARPMTDASDAVHVPAAAGPQEIDSVSHRQSSPVVFGAPAVNHLIGDAETALKAQELSPDPAHDPLDQVVLGLKSKLDSRTGKAEIRLDPPNLGAVKVSLTLESGTLTAQFESSSDVVRDLLKGNLAKLKSVLETQGLAVDRLSVEPPPSASSSGQNASFGSATHDGRSAGQYQSDARSQQRRPESEAFAVLFSKAQDAPLDLVA